MREGRVGGIVVLRNPIITNNLADFLKYGLSGFSATHGELGVIWYKSTCCWPYEVIEHTEFHKLFEIPFFNFLKFLIFA